LPCGILATNPFGHDDEVMTEPFGFKDGPGAFARIDGKAIGLKVFENIVDFTHKRSLFSVKDANIV
jgi:hypothetical protein